MKAHALTVTAAFAVMWVAVGSGAVKVHTQFDKTFDTNLKGYWHATRLLVLALRARGAARGAILNVASVAGLPR